jgi:catechol 2,3-dioxygenase-like lactoylglutathione lyase family enzyme
MTAVSVRYIVDDVDAAIGFYTERLGFNVELHTAPGFAMLSRGDLRLSMTLTVRSRPHARRGRSSATTS